MNAPIFLSPVFKERIWGGTRLSEHFGYTLPSPRTGECWAVSAHPNGQSTVKCGDFQGWALGDLWKHHPELFGYCQTDRFPLLTKIIDANQDLSVQVHPDDTYANRHENGELGKTECWYIIDCKPDAELILGHHAKSKDELKQWIAEGRWDSLLRTVKIQPGDFLFIPSGTIHALKEGTLILETQQNSDVTYRLYDYDRIDADGKKRELHIEKSLDVITVPHKDVKITPTVENKGDLTITAYLGRSPFSVYKWDIRGSSRYTQNQLFLLVSVIAGRGNIRKAHAEYSFQKGDHFLLPYGFGEFELQGEATCIVSHV